MQDWDLTSVGLVLIGSSITVAGTIIGVTGCETLQGLGTIAKAAGVNPNVVDGAVKSGEAFAKAKEKLTPENEYYIGRAVTAHQ